MVLEGVCVGICNEVGIVVVFGIFKQVFGEWFQMGQVICEQYVYMMIYLLVQLLDGVVFVEMV